MSRSRALDEVARRVHQHFIGDAQSLGDDHGQVIRRQVQAVSPLLEGSDLDAVTRRVTEQLFGLGALEPLLADASITEVMVNGPGPVWVERRGRLEATTTVVGADELRVVIERILGPLGLRVDRTAPFVDARLGDGSRVNIAVAPLAIDGPYITVRRFSPQPYELDSFCPGDVAVLLTHAIESRKSILVSGGTGSGKTSLLNALASHIAPGERVITIEDAAELRLPGEHTVRLEARPPNAEGIGQITIRSLVRNALRMRPDRLIIGEVRGAEALDMIQAMNTGHDGSLSSCHANSPVDALRRVEAMALMGDIDLPVSVLREHVSSAIDLVAHVERGASGARRVASLYRCGPNAKWLVKDGRCAN